jgi:hypothetical protein
VSCSPVRGRSQSALPLLLDAACCTPTAHMRLRLWLLLLLLLLLLLPVLPAPLFLAAFAFRRCHSNWFPPTPPPPSRVARIGAGLQVAKMAGASRFATAFSRAKSLLSRPNSKTNSRSAQQSGPK